MFGFDEHPSFDGLTEVMSHSSYDGRGHYATGTSFGSEGFWI